MSFSAEETEMLQAAITAINNLIESVEGFSEDLTTHETEASAHNSTLVNLLGTQTITGKKTFDSNILLDATSNARIISTTGDNGLRVQSASSLNAGGSLALFAGTYSESANQGAFSLYAAKTSSDRTILKGTPGGSLTWGGQEIQTSSDQRLKTQMTSVPENVLRAWGDVQWGQFQFLSAVAEKGKNARHHLGLIAQHVIEVFQRHGLDALEYGILCHEQSPAKSWKEEIKDAEGVTIDVIEHHEDAVDMWTIRYGEALAMECAYQRWRLEQLEERVNQLINNQNN